MFPLTSCYIFRNRVMECPTIAFSLLVSCGLYVHDLAISCALRDDSSLLHAINKHACAILYIFQTGQLFRLLFFRLSLFFYIYIQYICSRKRISV